MIPRYQTKEMQELWSEAKRYKTWLSIEIAQLEQRAFNQPDLQKSLVSLKKKSEQLDWIQLSNRIIEIESAVHHDVIAFLTALEEIFQEDAFQLHFGMTSSDVVDTAWGALLKEAGEQLLSRSEELGQIVKEKAVQYKNTPCLARTHGQAAEPTSFGLKLLSFYAEMLRNNARLKNAVNNISFGKLSGAVGNYGNSDPELEKKCLDRLGLSVETVATQVVCRDRHSEFFCTLAVMGGTLERLAIEIRHLMRSEVAEVFEPFGKSQRGSSAMPHKKNPILTENITGLARLLRGYALSSLENQALWHERDISHSSVERIIGPDATTVLDFALLRMCHVIKNMVVDENAMKYHLDQAGELIYSESVLLLLINKGLSRQTAYGYVQKAALSSRHPNTEFFKQLLEDPTVKQLVSAGELENIRSLKHHLRHVDTIFKRVLESN